MKDFIINDWALRFDNGTADIIRSARGIEEENALEGIQGWQQLAPWILYGGMERKRERDKGIVTVTKAECDSLIKELSPKETLDLINMYVRAMSVKVEEDQQVATEGDTIKKS